MKSRYQKRIEEIEKIGVPTTRQDFLRLVTMLRDQDYRVRRAAVEMMGNSMKKTCVPSLVRALQDPHHRVRMAAAQALGWIRDPRATPYLIHTALYDPDSDVSLSSILALQWIRDIHAVPGLFQITGDHVDPVIRKAAFGALLQYGRSLEPFLQRIVRDGKRSYRHIAEEILHRLSKRDSNDMTDLRAKAIPIQNHEPTRIHLPSVPDDDTQDMVGD